MDNRKRSEQLALAIFPSTRGIGFAVFEGPLRPLDWGVKEARGDKNELSRAKVSELVRWFKPDVLILEDADAKGSRRAPRIRALIEALGNDARQIKLDERRFSREEIRAAFAGATTRYEIAKAIAGQFREFEAALPPPRKIWMSENPRLAAFGAVSLIITFFENQKAKVSRRETTR